MVEKKTAWLVALGCFGGGIFYILIGTRIIPVDPESLQAPALVFISIGIICIVGGLWLLSPHVAALSWVANYTGLIMLTCFSVVLDWIAFGPGKREFECNIPFLGGELIGRTVFGIFGALLTCITAFTWYRGIIYWKSGRKIGEEQPEQED